MENVRKLQADVAGAHCHDRVVMLRQVVERQRLVRCNGVLLQHRVENWREPTIRLYHNKVNCLNSCLGKVRGLASVWRSDQLW